MTLTSKQWDRPRGSFVLLAPPRARLSQFDNIVEDPTRHQRLLANAQRLRGRLYLRDKAVGPKDLSWGGRHIQAADEFSWHLLRLDESERVTGCLRYSAHGRHVAFADLALSHAAIAESGQWGPVVQKAVREEINRAARLGFSYVELGGWAISEELRGGSDAIRMILSVYALAQLTGGAIGIGTATTRHHSSSILRRLGGTPLTAAGVEVPPYYDPRFRCEMELIRFCSTSPKPRYAALIEDHRKAMLEVPVFLPDPLPRFAATTRMVRNPPMDAQALRLHAS